MLRRGNRVSARRIHHDDPAFRRGIHIHVIHAHARAPNDFQLRGRLDDFRGGLGFTADHEAFEAPDDFEQLVRLEADLDGDIEEAALGEFIYAPLGDGIGDENFGLGHGVGKKGRNCLR